MTRTPAFPRLIPALAGCLLGLEYLARVLWAPLSVAAVFATIAAFDLLPGMGRWLHAGIVAGFAIACAAALRIGFSLNRPPTRHAILRRLEADSGLAHRPYDTVEDKVAATDRANEVWQAHQDRAAATLRRVKLSWAREAALARAGMALILIVALAIGCDRFGDRLDDALSPGVLGAVPASSIGFEAWITPPDYTGLPPILLSRGQDSGDVIEAPVGSTLEAHVTGGAARPHLLAEGKRFKFAAVDKTNYQLSTQLTQSGTIRVTQGWRSFGKWKLSLSDTPAPVVEWVKPPAADKSEVKFDYTAADQYGLATLTATTRLADEVRATMLPKGTALEDPAAGEFTVALSDVSGHPKSIKTSTLEDWTSNPWAGFPVTVTLTATGVSGKSATTEAQPLVLPERSFTDPVARAIIAERKKLTLDPVQQRIAVATAIAELSGHPELYHDDVTVFLVLRNAAARLWHDDQLAELRNVQTMLWQSALRLEDGGTGESSKAIADAAKALRDALNNGAPQSQIDKLTQALKQAMNQYLDQLQKDLQQRLARGEKIPMMPPGMGKTLDRKSLDDMVDRMNGLSQGGNRDAAKDALAQIESMMRNLRMAQKMQPGSKAMQAWDAMHQLNDLAEKQQQLNDDTYRRSQGESTQNDEMQSLNNGRSGDPNKRRQNQADSTGADKQQQLQNSLQGLQQKLGKLGAQVPGGLKESEQQMGDAAGKLQGKDYNGALPAQRQALDKLREGMQNLADQMNKEGQGGLAAGGNPDGKGEPGDSDSGDDPFGRDGMGRQANDPNVHVPDEDAQQRSRQILEELRKRSGERFRSHDERDYIDRLLKDY